MATYARQTVDSPNPLARYAHRHRLRRSLALAGAELPAGRLLDFGCGPGSFIGEMQAQHPGVQAFGYEPYMSETAAPGLPIHRSIDELLALPKFDLVTLFETVEHLSESEFDAFVGYSDALLAPARGRILVSAPIEIGPGLLLKELNRSVLRLRRSEHGLAEFLKAALLGVPAARAADIKGSHKGYDFRRTLLDFRRHGWAAEVLGYGPLPINTWYGNSQVYFVARRVAPAG